MMKRPLPSGKERIAVLLTGHLFRARIQKLKTQIMSEIKRHEYELLDEIAKDPMATQANLSNNLGIAIGSVNWYIKRLIHRGWIKVSHLNRTRLKYDLTPEGMTIFTQRALSYARHSLQVYGDFRRKAKALVAELKQEAVKEVYLEGDDEAMDILRLTCIEMGIRISNAPDGLILSMDGQEYRWILKSD